MRRPRRIKASASEIGYFRDFFLGELIGHAAEAAERVLLGRAQQFAFETRPVPKRIFGVAPVLAIPRPSDSVCAQSFFTTVPSLQAESSAANKNLVNYRCWLPC